MLNKNKLNYEEVFNAMVKHLKNYIKENNRKSVVLGISGGIDSTIVSCICYQVSKELNNEGYDFTFYGRSLPSSTTNIEELSISIDVGQSFCDDFKVYDCDILDDVSTMIFRETNKSLVPIHQNDEYVDKLRKGNIKSRLRMIELYDLARAKQGMVIGTDNYTEYLLGFSTIGGDALFDYCPIQYLWKTEVYEMAEYIKEYYKDDAVKVDAINKSIMIAPQDGLGISNNDVEQIGGKDYNEIDDILYNICYSGKIPNEDDYTSGAVEKIYKRFKDSEFKRSHPFRLSRDYYDNTFTNDFNDCK